MSQFIEMFGSGHWEQKCLGEVGTFKRGGGFQKSDYVECGIPCIHYGQIHTKFGPFIYSHISEISSDLECKTKFASKGDLIIAITSEDTEGSCKSTAWLGDYPVAVGGHAAIFHHSMNPVYMSFFFKSVLFNHAKMEYIHGTKVCEIKPDDIAKILVPYPPMSLQEEFSSIAQQADKSKFVGFKSQFIEMSKAWPVMKLNGHVDIIRGVSYKPSDVVSSLDANSVGILRANNIANGEINTNEMVYVDQSRVSDAQRIRIGDIIVCASSGSQSLVGKAAINKNLTREYAHGAFCLLIRCNNTILPKYLNIYLQTALYRNQIESLSCGSNILNIKAGHLTSLDIPIPDIKQQSDFVTIIEQADKSKLVLLQIVKSLNYNIN